MKAFFHQTLKLMGAEVRELPRDELHVGVPKNSQACRLLTGASEHRLAFSSKHNNRHAAVVAPGSALLETAVQQLEKIGSVRHGTLPALFSYSRKNLKNKYAIFAGTCEKFSCKRGWQTTVRLWVKAVLSGDEVVEILEGVEILPHGHPRRIESAAMPGSDVQWIEKPPLKLYQLKEFIEAGMEFAGNLIIDTAEELQTKNFKRFYATLEKLRIYYHQLYEETVRNGKEEFTAAIEAEYQRRKQEELQYARVKATVELVAVETISTPVQQLQWQLERNGNCKRVETTLNLFNGEIMSPAGCSICDTETWSLGLSRSNVLVCPTCYITCDFCGDEVLGEQVSTNRMCSICGKKLCKEHGSHCETCGELVCEDHQVKCDQGCCICPECIQTCCECGNDVTWCRNHTTINSEGDVFCRNHAVYCIGCRDYYPSQKTEACNACGQTVCLTCQESCKTCTRIFCLNHITNGECKKCPTNNSQMNLF